jgi:hypothetical protein
MVITIFVITFKVLVTEKCNGFTYDLFVSWANDPS